ncbi:MAG TPA: ABC transporter ATP-binding protein [Methanoculleus sp.]|jgi:ABC-2 type transport system ATP-binding protein|uniref:ABC transporter ATP-binding protein n=1 Tax=Methanoculleus receptaculi TaxID=394967 RepID=A0AAX4FUV1_9EURY|nr:ATP-binding cassette domain-containing protein [Methanoculleus receptaculi]MDK2862939.1 type transport system ATP-binding protein [Methanomicrobiaceae archaeon]HIH85641.1 ABC transporter ATP-binding protein [Methanoculleus sp.]WOX57213.1 ABC transporter ATP-binding protein [Methanoculleus receptaculi]HOD85784.1 ABC transporter ATP-binding protein [Methanoculleus sp.]HPD51849.1 ABC transporter ATP-binding protein [Methanoculleus sp.]
MIRTENLTKVYNGKPAVDGLNLEVGEGEIFGFLGPNGAGKSTTILMLTGMIEPTAGRCFVDGIEVANDPLAVKRIIGYLPEDVGFYGNLTGEQNLDYFARFYDMNAADRKERIAEILRLVHLDGVTQKAGEYSRGMKQRLGLAQALINDPKVLFLDEPTANLDPEGVREYRDLVTRLAGEGKTVFVSSHILSEVRAVCRTVGLLAAGRLVAQGTIDEVARTLASPGGETFRIVVETAEDLPDLSDPDIIEFERDGNRAVIQAKSDIRERLAAAIAEEGLHIREIRLEEPSIEDAFMALYRG